jgi:hypothetical protein
MPLGLSMVKARAISSAADQVFSSLSNGLIVYAVAVVTPSANFGRIALLLTLLAAAIGILRGATGTPLLLTAGRPVADIRREGSFALTSALLVSPVVGAMMWAVTGPGIHTVAVWIIVATPIVLVQDALRYVVIAEGRAHVAAFWDGLWFVGSAALLIATWLRLPAVTPVHLLAGWTALAFGSLLGMLLAVRIGPGVRQFRAWIADGWQHRARYGIDSGLEQVLVFAVLFFVAVCLSPGVAAALRGANALLAPVSVATSALPLAVIPESRRQNMTPPQVWKSLTRITMVTSSGSLLLGVALFFLSPSIGQLVLGRTFEATQSIILIYAFEFALAAWCTAVAIYLRAFNRSADALKIKLCYVLAMMLAVPAAGLAYHSAAAVATAVAAAMTFYLALALFRVKPWVNPVDPSVMGRRRRDAPDSAPPSAPAAVVPATQAQIAVPVDTGNCEPRPLALATTLRLREPRKLNEALIMLWVFAVLAVLGPALIITFTGAPTNLSWLWSLPGLAICSARFAWLIGKGERRLFELMFWAYVYMFLALAPLVQMRMNEWPGTVPRVDNTYIGAAELIVVIGCCAFLAGAGLDTVVSTRRGWQAGKRATTQALTSLFTVNHRRTVVLCGFAVLLNAYYLSKLGWLQFMYSRYEMQDRAIALFPTESVGVVLRACTSMTLLVAFVALLRFRKEAKLAMQLGEHVSAKLMRFNMVLLIVMGILLADNLNPISNARYQSGTAMLAAATAYGLFATAKRFRLTSCGFLAALLVIFPLADAFRFTSEAQFKAGNPIESLMSDDYDSFAQIMNGYLIAVRDGIVPGRQFLGVLTWWVPRDMWPGKPVDTGMYIANMRGYGFTNLSSPLWVELFLNGSWVFLVISMLLMGFGLHRWDTRLDGQFERLNMPSVLGCILPFYMLILLRGSLLQASSFLFFILASSAFVRQPFKPAARTRLATATASPTRVSRKMNYVPA